MAYWGSHARVFQLVLHSFCVFWPFRSRGGVPPGHVTTLVRDLIPQLARGPLICPKQNPEQIAHTALESVAVTDPTNPCDGEVH